MKTWHIRLVDPLGHPVSQWRALRRYVLCWIWFVPSLATVWLLQLTPLEALVLVTGWCAIWAILSRFHAQKQFWHDAWAGTRLIAVTSAPG